MFSLFHNHFHRLYCQYHRQKTALLELKKTGHPAGRLDSINDDDMEETENEPDGIGESSKEERSSEKLSDYNASFVRKKASSNRI